MQLYKSLVRPHLEYAVPVWAAASAKDLDKVEQTQVQCLKRIVGAKAHSSGSAIEVITATYPMKIRIRELFSREYLRTMYTDQGNQLRDLFSSSSRKELRFCPLDYLSVMSKQLSRRLDGCCFSSQPDVSAAVMLQPTKVIRGSVTSSDSYNFCNKSQLEKQRVVEEVFTSFRFMRVSPLWFLLMDQCMKLLLDVEHVLLCWFRLLVMMTNILEVKLLGKMLLL